MATPPQGVWGQIRAYDWGKRDWISAAIGAGTIVFVNWVLREFLG